MNATTHTSREQKLLKNHSVSLLMAGHKGSASTNTELLFIAEVNRRAQTVTPLLKEILEFRPPLHWK